jgi:hypothetical protein
MRSPRCANLGPRGQDSRLRAGAVGFTVTLALAIGLAKLGVAPEVRWLLALPFFGSVMMVTQALYGTCPFMAAKGLRDGVDGEENPEIIANPDELKMIRTRGRRVVFASAAIALTAAGLFAQLGA